MALNALAGDVADMGDMVEAMAEGGVPSGGQPSPAWDPGDLSVYYENGKA